MILGFQLPLEGALSLKLAIVFVPCLETSRELPQTSIYYEPGFRTFEDQIARSGSPRTSKTSTSRQTDAGQRPPS